MQCHADFCILKICITSSFFRGGNFLDDALRFLCFVPLLKTGCIFPPPPHFIMELILKNQLNTNDNFSSNYVVKLWMSQFGTESTNKASNEWPKCCFMVPHTSLLSHMPLRLTGQTARVAAVEAESQLDLCPILQCVSAVEQPSLTANCVSH